MNARHIIWAACSLISLNASAAQYRIIQITDNAFDDYKPQINDVGQMAWIENHTALPNWLGDNLVFRNARSAADTVLTSERGRIGMFDLNEGGAIAWGDKEVYCFDGASTVKLTDDGYTNMDVHLNDANHVIWNRRINEVSDIFWYDGTAVVALTSYPTTNGSHPYISETDDTLWMASSDLVHLDQVVLNGDVVNDAPLLISGARFNDNQQVVWIAQVEDVDNSHEVVLYDDADGVSALLTDDERADMGARINSEGHVCWIGGYWGDHEIMLYDGMSSRRISDPTFTNHIQPEINDGGWVVWTGHDGNDSEIFVYDGMERVQVTEDAFNVGFPQINDLGMIVWQQYDGNDYEIFLGIPMTDCNGNGIPDECDLDCSGTVELTGELCSDLFPECGASSDENGNEIPDECESAVPALSMWGNVTLMVVVVITGVVTGVRRQYLPDGRGGTVLGDRGATG